MGWTVDTRPLRESMHFRNLWIGQVISMIGTGITLVAVPFQIFRLTHSPLAVGMIGAAQVVPLVGASLLAGSLSDRYDRRTVVRITQSIQALCSLVLCFTALAVHPSVVIIYVAVFISAGAVAIGGPARTAMIVNLVEPEHRAGALSLNFGIFQLSSVVGPSLGGAIISNVGLPAAYGIDAVTFVAALIAISTLPRRRPAASERERPIAALRRGWRHLRSTPEVLGGYAMDLNAMIFGMPRAIFPVLALEWFHVNATGLGFLYSAIGLGGVVAIIFGGWAGSSRTPGRIVVGSIAVWGFSIVLFGFVHNFVLALALLVIAGAADVFSGICRNVMMQNLTPDDLRGRLSAVYSMVVAGGPYVGDIEAGSVAGIFGAQFAVVSGGALCVAGLLICWRVFPSVWHYRQQPHSG